MLACVSANGGVKYHGDKPLSVIKVGTIGGVYTFERESLLSPWLNKGVSRPDFHVGSLLFEPGSGYLFAGTHGGGGLWRSTDLGNTWEELTNGLSHRHIYSIQCQYIDGKPRLWVGAEPASLFMSNDLGKSWVERKSIKTVPENENWTFPPPPHIAHVKGVSWHDSNPDRIFVLVEQGGLFVSDDAGLSWEELKGYLIGDQKFYRDCHRLCIAEDDPNRMYFATGDGLCRSLDGGINWKYLLTKEDRIGYPDAMFIDPNNTQKLVIGGPTCAPEDWRTTQNSEATVLVSYDGGDTWLEKSQGMNAPLKGNIEAMGLYSTVTTETYIAGTAIGQLFISEDGCENWVCIADDLPPISKAGHYRWFLSDAERATIEERMRAWKNTQSK